MTRAIAAEWIKLRRPAVLLGTLGASVAFTILATALTFTGLDDAGGDGTPAPRPGGDVMAAELSEASGLLHGLAAATEFLGIVALVLFASSVASEYTHGTLRNLLVREPRRLRLLGGKLLALALLVSGATVIAAATSAVVALSVAPGSGVDIAAWSSAEGVGTALLRTAEAAAAMLGHGILGAALAVALRSSVAAIGIGVAYVLPVETILSGTLSGASAWLRGDLLAAIAQDGTDDVALGRAALVAGLYALAACIASGWSFLRRDVVA